MTEYKLTIAIPTYNRPTDFKRLLTGLIPQLTPETEIVIRDDSTDNSSKDIFYAAIKGKKVNFQYFTGEKIGLDAASIFLVENSRGKFFWLFSDDDELLSGGVEAVLGLIDQYPGLTFVWANFDSDFGTGLNVKGRSSGFFESNNEALEVLGTGIGLVSTQIFKREIGMRGLPISRKHSVGFSFASTATYIFVLSEPGQYYFLNGPYILCHPTRTDEIIAKTNQDGKIINNGFQVYGINFFNIVMEFRGKFRRKSIRKMLKTNFRSTWKGMFVGWVRGWDTPAGKRLKMLRTYWTYPEAWFVLFVFLAPLRINKFLYEMFKKYKSSRLARKN